MKTNKAGHCIVWQIIMSEQMEMPCRCDCGNWFDLEDGYRSLHSNIVVCKECHKKEKAIHEIEEEIKDIEIKMDNDEIGKRIGKKQLKELQQKQLRQKYE